MLESTHIYAGRPKNHTIGFHNGSMYSFGPNHHPAPCLIVDRMVGYGMSKVWACRFFHSRQSPLRRDSADANVNAVRRQCAHYRQLTRFLSPTHEWLRAVVMRWGETVSDTRLETAWIAPGQ